MHSYRVSTQPSGVFVDDELFVKGDNGVSDFAGRAALDPISVLCHDLDHIRACNETTTKKKTISFN